MTGRGVSPLFLLAVGGLDRFLFLPPDFGGKFGEGLGGVVVAGLPEKPALCTCIFGGLDLLAQLSLAKRAMVESVIGEGLEPGAKYDA